MTVLKQSQPAFSSCTFPGPEGSKILAQNRSIGEFEGAGKRSEPPKRKKCRSGVAHRGRRSGIPDYEPLEGYVLTPQAFSTSNLALGPVLNRSGNNTTYWQTQEMAIAQPSRNRMFSAVRIKVLVIYRRAKPLNAVFRYLFPQKPQNRASKWLYSRIRNLCAITRVSVKSVL